jgi:peptidoglycan/LPS O-acetylase OafA/YrhL
LIAIVMFGVLAYLLTVARFSSRWQRLLERAASYSYSLYLLHNTILIVVLEALPIENLRVRAAVGVVLAHVCSYLLYLAFERHYRAVAAWLRPRFENVFTIGRSHASTTSTSTGTPAPPLPDLAVRKP